MFGKFGQQFAAIVCTVLVSATCLVAAVGPATGSSQFGGQSAGLAARSFA
ncbi:MAG: hypothetical protein JWN21_277 [Sphingomonas bacterium]|nr:hypothetical protein [Sphingomonas bacterium]MDB5694734.1 hypothetical protein [Sphingomonas bacterium]